MEHFVVQNLVQWTGASASECGGLCWIWNWGYLVSFLVGVAGTIFLFLRKPTD